MADEALQTPSQEDSGQAGTPSQEQPVAGQADVTSGSETTPVTDESEKQSVNLYELPEFKEIQSAWDRQIAEAKRKAEEAERVARELAMRDMEPEERAYFEKEQAERALAAERQRLAMMQAELAKQQDLLTISRETGIPVEKLAKANDLNEAWRMGNAYMKRSIAAQQKKARANAAAQNPANQVDTGAGMPRTPESETERRMREALASGNTQDYYRELLGQKFSG